MLPKLRPLGQKEIPEPEYTCAVCGVVTDAADLCFACEMEAAS